MTKAYYPFDAGAGANIAEAQWSKMAKHWLASGVISGYLNALEVYGDSSGMQVKIKTGGAWVEGHYYENDAIETVAIATADGSNPRIDRVVVRLDWGANTIDTAVLQGTPAASPTAPALTQNTSTWEISLAQVLVGTGVTTIASGNVTSERTLVGGASDGFQTGDTMHWFRRTPRSGWLFEDGSAVSRTTYAALFEFLNENIGNPTLSIATPCVLSFTAHGLNIGDTFYLTTTGALPTGVSANTLYYVITAGFGANSFQFSASRDGAAINSSGTQSGTHTLRACPCGLGDGSTTFNLPAAPGRSLVGRGTHVDVRGIGQNDGVAAGSRTPKHGHVQNVGADVNGSLAGNVAAGSGDNQAMGTYGATGSLKLMYSGVQANAGNYLVVNWIIKT